MSAISLKVFSVFNDRGSIISNLTEEIEIDANDIRTGDVLPGWKWSCPDDPPPRVDYYDGETIDVFFEGKMFTARVGGKPLTLLEADCPGNMYVRESRRIALSLNEMAVASILPRWSEMFSHESFNALAVNAYLALRTDSSAARWFTRVFSVVQNLFLLLPETVGLLESGAEAGEPYALFALGRYHLLTMPTENSQALAMECFEKSWAKGLPEAAAALGRAYDWGDIGIVDRLRARAFLQDAIDIGCEFVSDYMLRKTLHGLHGTPEDPAKALRLCDELIAYDRENYGDDEVNPAWHFWRGACLQKIDGFTHGYEEFRKAAERGFVPAWLNLAVTVSHDDDGELIGRQAYLKALRTGVEHHNSDCAYFLALSKMDDFDNMHKYMQLIALGEYAEDMGAALKMGSYDAALALGDMYAYGEYGAEKDMDKAYHYYLRGAELGNETCFEQMFEMFRCNIFEASQGTVDQIAIHGARLGSEKLLGETVKAYLAGRLTECASEIEQYYIPLFSREVEED